MIDFIANNFYNLISILPQECSLLNGNTNGESMQDILNELYLIVEIATPILVVLLCTIDIAKAVIAQDDNEMKKSQSRSIKRLIIGLAIFLIPTLLDALLKLAGLAQGICKIGL